MIIYYNSDSNFIKSPNLILGFYIILIFINITYRILNNDLSLNFKKLSCLFKNPFKYTSSNYAIILLMVAIF